MNGYGKHAGEGAKPEGINKDEREDECWYRPHQFQNATYDCDNPWWSKRRGSRKGKQKCHQSTQYCPNIGNQQRIREQQRPIRKTPHPMGKISQKMIQPQTR